MNYVNELQAHLLTAQGSKRTHCVFCSSKLEGPNLFSESVHKTWCPMIGWPEFRKDIGAESETDLWEFGGWSVMVDNATGKIKVVDLSTGVVDWPIGYPDGRVSFDRPERLPEYVKSAASLALANVELDAAQWTLCTMMAIVWLGPGEQPILPDPIEYNASHYQDFVSASWQTYIERLRESGYYAWASIAEMVEWK